MAFKFINCVGDKIEIPHGKELAIPSNEKIGDEDIETFITEEIVKALKLCGADMETKDPRKFNESLKRNRINIQNLMFPKDPLKDGLYFYKGKLLVKFVFIPRKEGIDVTNYFGSTI